MKILAVMTGEGFRSPIELHDDGGKEEVIFIADLDVDVDGANGQSGKRAAYMLGDKGRELLANGGMAMRGGKVVGVKSWWTDIVLSGPDGEPLVLANGVVPSMTSYKYPGKAVSDPARYVDAEDVPYICVPSIVLRGTVGAVLGCACEVEYLPTGAKCSGVVADSGPPNKNGEASAAMARKLGINDDPRSGGVDAPKVRYRIFPGRPAIVNGHVFILQRSNGQYVAT